MLRLYVCEICGNLIEMIEDSGVVPVCCNQPMKELEPSGEKEEGLEKHVPIVTSCRKSEQLSAGECKPTRTVAVQVGEIKHPMSEIHRIQWVTLKTDRGTYRQELHVEEDPIVCFVIGRKERIKAIYSYCNLHGLWFNDHPMEVCEGILGHHEKKDEAHHDSHHFGFEDKMPGH